MDLLPLATKKKGPVLYWEVRFPVLKNQLDLIQTQRSLKEKEKEKKKNAFKRPWGNSNLVNFYNGLPKGINSILC